MAVQTTKYEHVDSSNKFSFETVRQRIAKETELISNYTLSKEASLKDFMVYMYKAFEKDSRLVSMLSSEEVAVYFKALGIVANYAMEDVKITKPATTTKAGLKAAIADMDDDVWGSEDEDEVDLSSLDRGRA